MARKPRIHIPGAFYHVILRGNGGQDIFLSDVDRIRFCLLLQEGVERYKHRIHAFCLMSNHVHLLVQVSEVNLSLIVQNVSFRFSRFFNARHKRTGHLFQGRFKGLLVDKDSYFLELARYIHCNPVRAGIVKNPDEYPWSSHRAYLGKNTICWLTRELVLSQFASSKNGETELYADYVQQGIGESYRQQFHGVDNDKRIIGTDHFIEKVLASVDRKYEVKTTVDRIVEVVSEEYQVPQEKLAEQGKKRVYAEARAIAAFLVQGNEQLSLTELAHHLNRDLSALSRAADTIRERIQENPTLAEKISSLRNQL